MGSLDLFGLALVRFGLCCFIAFWDFELFGGCYCGLVTVGGCFVLVFLFGFDGSGCCSWVWMSFDGGVYLCFGCVCLLVACCDLVVLLILLVVLIYFGLFWWFLCLYLLVVLVV